MEKKEVMSAELAEEEFNAWAENMGIDTDADAMRSETDETVLASGKRTVIRALAKGSLVTDDSGDLVYTVSKKSPEGYAGEKIKITTPPPRAFVSSGKKSGNETNRVLAVMSGMTGKDTGWFMNLNLADFKFFAGVAGLFLID